MQTSNMGINKIVSNVLAVLLILVLIKRQEVAAYDENNAKQNCEDFQKKIMNVLLSQSALSNKPSEEYKEKQQQNWLDRFNYKTTSNEFMDILNECMNTNGFETKYTQCVDDLKKNGLAESFVDVYIKDKAGNLTEEEKTNIVTMNCAGFTTPLSSPDNYEKAYMYLLQLKDDEVTKKLRDSYKACEVDMIDDGKVRKCVEKAIKSKASPSNQPTSYGPKSLQEKCNLAEIYYKAIKSDKQRRSYPSKKFDKHSLHYRIDLLLVDAWRGEKLYEDVTEYIDCDWVIPKYRHNKKDVINCMYETGHNKPVINDILECVYSQNLQLKPTYANYNAFKSVLTPYMAKYEAFRDRCKIAIEKEEEEALDKFLEEYDSMLKVQKNRKDIETIATDCVEQNKHRGTSLLSRKMKECVLNKQISQVCGRGDFFCNLVKDLVIDFDDDELDDEDDDSLISDSTHDVHHHHHNSYDNDNIADSFFDFL